VTLSGRYGVPITDDLATLCGLVGGILGVVDIVDCVSACASRIDRMDHVGGITDEIMAEIRRSRFVIADHTGHVNGVYFEVGFALGRELTVIPTCRGDQVGALPFDIKHLNTLLWQTPQDLAINLERRIRAVVGTGPDSVASS
jgi:hypothetical protein